MKKYFLLFLILSHLNAFTQISTQDYNFSYKVMEVAGDLNKDGLADKVVVTQDTLNENAPYRLQVFFKGAAGEWKLKATSLKIIEPQYPNGRDGYRTGTGFSDVTIKAGVLSINIELLRGHFEHEFKFQNGRFELIHFSFVSSDGRGVIETIDFNLITGIRVELLERYDTDKVISNKKTKIIIKPLPTLQNVVPMEQDLF